MTRVIVQATPFCLSSSFEVFRLFHLLETLLTRTTVSVMLSTPFFLYLMVKFSCLFISTSLFNFNLQSFTL